MKITVDVCKLAIVERCKNTSWLIRNEFDPPLTEEELEKTLKIKNWKQEYKSSYQKLNGKKYIERIFDCRPFDSQLRGYVYTDENDTRIEKVEVLGE